tara:strand:+ start:71 stop:322 length:252 start_codon:yes stop_codon:yes gene_type:complete
MVHLSFLHGSLYLYQFFPVRYLEPDRCSARRRVAVVLRPESGPVADCPAPSTALALEGSAFALVTVFAGLLVADSVVVAAVQN